MATGTIARLVRDRGFGFIKVDGAKRGDKDLFFHKDDMCTEPGFTFEELEEGVRVEFGIDSIAAKGPRAQDVTPE